MARQPLPTPPDDEPGALLLAELLSLPEPAASVVARGMAIAREIRVRWLVPRAVPESKPDHVHEVLVAGQIMLRGPLVLLGWVRRPRHQPPADARPRLA